MRTPPAPLELTPVRRSVSVLVPELQHLTINTHAIKNLADEIADEAFPLPEWRAPVFPDETRSGITTEDVLNFLFLGNAINFQFRDYDTGGKFAADYAGTEWRGAFGMWACLKREYEENPAILTGETLATLSKDDVDRIFANSNGIALPMLEERLQILTAVGDRLKDHYEGEFAQLVKNSEPALFANGDGIVDTLLQTFPSFQDSSVVDLSNNTQLEVLFWKRAQLAPGMAYGRFQDSSSFTLTDPGAFTVFVDYNIPNVLRAHNILTYSDHLAEQIDTRQIVTAESREEVELRAATIHAADLLIEEINSQREKPIYAPHLDYKLFTMRNNISTPIHLTKTTAY